jgi:hypothetical protein
MNRTLILLVFVLYYISLTAQTELNAFTSTGSGYATPTITDYESLGINPANLGWTRNDNSMNIGFFEFGGSIYSEPLTKKEIYSDLYSNPITLNYEGKIEAANAFTNTRMISTASMLLVGFSYQDENIGGFAFNIRQRFTWHSLLNENAANYLFLGYNDIYFDSTAFENGDEVGYSTNPQYATELYSGSDNHMLMYTEFNFGYGRKVIKKDNISWYLGVNVKYILGQAMARYYEEESGKLLANSSLSPGFGVVYSGEGVYEGTVNTLEGSGLKTVGNGFGFDIGSTLEIKQKILIGLALNNIGYIKWKKNVYEGWDGGVWRIDTPGINNYNIFEEGQLINTDNGPPPLDTTIVGISNLKLNLPLHFRGGISYTFNEYVEAGLDTYFPLGEKVPGSFEAPIYSIGARTNPAAWVQLSIGIVSGGKFGTNVPFGATFYPIRNEKNTWEIGIATRDMLTFFKQDNPTVSYAFGFLRFSFGQLKE